MDPTYWAWGGFLAFVFAVLAVDLGLLNRKAHVISVREALLLTVIICGLALAFNGLVWRAYEHQWLGLGSHVDRVDGIINTGRLAAVKFLTAYLIELSLSADNVFVMAMIFAHLRIPPLHQHRVLFWGILGALIMRGLMIVLGASLVARYHWVLYLFGFFLVYTAYKMLTSRDVATVDTEEAFVITQLRRVFPITGQFDDARFITTLDGVRMLTPLAVALVLIETMDLIFALDSIPATFAITSDPFLVFTSNIFAILGLRSLYFVLAGVIEKFRYLKVSLAAILGLIGVKMLLADVLHQAIGPNFNVYLLGVVVLILVAGALASVYADQRAQAVRR